ncbi:hypothetical protein DPMN_044846 [Dreissena polymorpha]|uniref:Uncharacterized protein n=1 Tax=Dreissena polymorpha TaxID=45954 RepID=A0A9D4HZ65_DREPO|nr:hypothetical protein DPMN_044846 [Dreissena polymorpha]
MKCTVQYDGSSSDAFDIRSEVKQGGALAPTITDIFSVLTEGKQLRTRAFQ